MSVISPLRTTEFPIRRAGRSGKKEVSVLVGAGKDSQGHYESACDVVKPREMEPGCRAMNRSSKGTSDWMAK